MARTLDPTAHALRRDEFIDVAQRLIAQKGYDALSIQEVLDELGASKGAFYHYFDSKGSLLEAVVERMTDTAFSLLAGLADDPDLRPPQKFERLFSSLADYKNQRRDFLLSLIQVWYSDGNALMREHLRRSMVVRLQPVLADIVREGRADGSFTTHDPDAVAGVIVSLMQGANETAGRLYLAYEDGAATIDDVERTLQGYSIALDRILGLPDGSLVVGDPAVLRQWFA